MLLSAGDDAAVTAITKAISDVNEKIKKGEKGAEEQKATEPQSEKEEKSEEVKEKSGTK